MPPPPIPATLLQRAFSTPAGDWAWPLADVPDAAGALAASGLAIVGAEVWLVLTMPPYEHTHITAIPLAGGGAEMFAWQQLHPWDACAEPWADFCRRCAAAAARFPTDCAVAAKARPEYCDSLHLQLAYCAEEEY